MYRTTHVQSQGPTQGHPHACSMSRNSPTQVHKKKKTPQRISKMLWPIVPCIYTGSLKSRGRSGDLRGGGVLCGPILLCVWRAKASELSSHTQHLRRCGFIHGRQRTMIHIVYSLSFLGMLCVVCLYACFFSPPNKAPTDTTDLLLLLFHQHTYTFTLDSLGKQQRGPYTQRAHDGRTRTRK